MTFEDMLQDEPYKSCYNKGLADGEAKGRQDAIDEFDKRLDLRIKIGNTVMLMADSKFYEVERKNIYKQALEDMTNKLKDKPYWDDEHNFQAIPIDYIDEVLEELTKK